GARASLVGLEPLSRVAAGAGRICRSQPESLADALSLASDHRTLAALAAVSAQRALSHHRHTPSQTVSGCAALVRPDHAGRFRLDGVVSRFGLAFSDADAGAQNGW